MELKKLVCPNCGYKKELLVGSSDREHTLSDLNEDFAEYRIYHCPEGKELHSLDANDREFDGKCPIHDVDLEELEDVPGDCPKCGGPLSHQDEDV
jgi:transcription initiation factor IIE alpha subunit